MHNSGWRGDFPAASQALLRKGKHAALRERVRQATLTEKSAAETVRLLARYHRLLTAMRTITCCFASPDCARASIRQMYSPLA